MGLVLYYREAGSSILVPLDITADKISDLKLQVSYQHPARLTWIMHQAQHTQPIPDRADILLLDTDFGPDIYSPVFEGHVHEIQPTASNEVAYTAYDPTKRAGDEITIFSGDTFASATVPRLVYNAKIENDEDYAWNRRNDATVGEMIKDILDDAANELEPMMAAPDPDSSSTENSPPYDQSELDSMDFQPQEKIVFESERLRGGIDRLLAWYPSYRLIFDPQPDRKWRFRKVVPSFDDSSSSSGGALRPPEQKTLTLNSEADKKVMSLSLTRSLEQRYTAVEFSGPPTFVIDTAYVSEGSDVSSESTTGGFDDNAGLIEKWSSGDEGVFVTNGPGTNHTGSVSRVWQVANPVRRRISRMMPEAIIAPIGDFDSASPYVVIAQQTQRLPSLQATWDNGSSWLAVTGFTLDVQNGIITAPAHVYRDTGSGIELPDDVRFVYAYMDEPLLARYPASGFEGTAFSVAGVEVVYHQYDEDFITGYEEYTQVTAAQRTEQFEKLAKAILEAHRDVVFTGGCVLDGIDYDFLRLNKLINFAAADGSGGTIATGWEEIEAILSDVEYDFDQGLTTLQFSSDFLEYLQQDSEVLKQQLKIKALEPGPPGIRIYYSGPGFEAQSTVIGPGETVDFRENEGTTG